MLFRSFYCKKRMHKNRKIILMPPRQLQNARTINKLCSEQCFALITFSKPVYMQKQMHFLCIDTYKNTDEILSSILSFLFFFYFSGGFLLRKNQAFRTSTIVPSSSSLRSCGGPLRGCSNPCRKKLDICPISFFLIILLNIH